MGNCFARPGKFSSGFDRYPPSVGPTVLRSDGSKGRSRGNATHCLEDGKSQRLRVVVADFTDVGLGDAQITIQETPQGSADEGGPEVLCQSENVDSDNDSDDTARNGQPPAVSIRKPTPEKVSGDTTKGVGSRNPSTVKADLGGRDLRMRKCGRNIHQEDTPESYRG